MPSLETALMLITGLVGATGLESRAGLIGIAASRGRIQG
jgi:hypothetical protein